MPVVFPSNTPERISTESVSFLFVVYLLWPGFLRSRNTCISASLNGSPAGQPSTTTPIPGPCYSPRVEMRNILPNSESLMLVESPFICFLISLATVRPVLLSGRRTAWWQNCYGVYYIGRRGFLTSIRSTFIIFQRLLIKERRLTDEQKEKK